MTDLADIQDVDRDSIYILPLSIIPLQAEGLRRLRMVKNDDLESVVEVYGGKGGSGQIPMGALEQNFPDIKFADTRILRKLSELTSYDVFSLRVHLRNLGIEVNDDENLKLSGSKQTELRDYMTAFTQRLILEVFGKDDAEIKDFNDVLELYKNPDRELARAKLNVLAESLGVPVAQVPGFLEDYGDIYLSIAYYKECLDSVAESIESFQISLGDIRRHLHLQQDRSLMSICSRLERKVDRLSEAATERFQIFETYTDRMWEDINPDRFQGFKDIVIDNHTAMGAILCTLSVKMGAWLKKFPSPTTGGIFNRAEFIRVAMQRGF